MNQAWNMRVTNMYLPNSHQIAADACYNSSQNFNDHEMKLKAYINPNIVKYSHSFSNANGIRISRKIHINPNFKGSNGSYYQHLSDSALANKETTSVHINPYFRQGNMNYMNSVKAVDISLTQLPQKMDEDSKSWQASGERTILLKCGSSSPIEGISGILKTSQSATRKTKPVCSSAYFWSKSNIKHPLGLRCDSFDKQSRGKKCDALKTYSITKETLPFAKSSIKAKHKMVRGVDSNSIYHTLNRKLNCKLRVQNRYKIVNIKKAKPSATLQKKHVSDYSKNNHAQLIKSENTDLVCERQVDTSNIQRSDFRVSLYKRNSYVSRITHLIRTKYMLQSRTLFQKRKYVKLEHGDKYKLDKRKKVMESIKRKKNENMYDKKQFLKPRLVNSSKKPENWKSEYCKNYIINYSNALVWRRKEASAKYVKRAASCYPNKALVNIGGIMYKATTNKLTRTKEKKLSSHCCKKELKTKTIMRSGTKLHTVYVRGEKFLLGDGGKTLIRQPNGENNKGVNKYSIKRVDIGGVTYVQKSNNVLIQTKTHQARNFVNYAKHRSIALLSNLHKRSNMPCMIYHKFGVCKRHTKGMCIYVHDPKNVALCKKFLRGKCLANDCLLSHNVVKEKMATCHFFLKGNCIRENCPFLHVKVNKRAAICKNFLQGFCPLGQDCKKRHVYQCPEFDEKGNCSKGVKCQYPHITKVKTSETKGYKITKFRLTKKAALKYETRGKRSTTHKVEKNDMVDGAALDTKNMNRKTKTEKSRTKKRKRKKITEELNVKQEQNDSFVECIPKRIKLQELPSFISLTSL